MNTVIIDVSDEIREKIETHVANLHQKWKEEREKEVLSSDIITRYE